MAAQQGRHVVLPILSFADNHMEINDHPGPRVHYH
ncbi:hypothetical protein QF001_001619 [Paraburkholderia youngii]